jgi:hypothetical protein
MSTARGLVWAGASALLAASFGGCVSTAGDGHGARLSDNLEIYAPFDNERDWGPSFLVGPPAHDLGGDQTRIDDTRAIPRATELGAADPSTPPLTEQPSQISPPLP